jgi:RNA polymerase-associated protein RTF1
MSESDAASDSEGASEDAEEDRPIFPYEKLYYSAKDKEEIMALPEIQREQILSERAQEVDRRNQDLALRRLLASRERDEARRVKKSKRKASVADLEEGQRKSSRQKTTLGGRKVGEASEAIEAYKRQREKKGKRDELRRRDMAAGEAAPAKDEAPSDKDAEGESEVEWDNRERSPSPPKDDPPADLRDIQRARVGRTNFAQVCFYPGFDEAISGCYARVNIGPNRDTGINEYRLCLIKSMWPSCFDPNCTYRPALLTHSRIHRGTTLRHGKPERSVVCDKPVRCFGAWKSGARIPFHSLL